MADLSSAEATSSVVPAGVTGDTSLMWAEFAGRLRAFVARRVPAGIEPDDVVQEVCAPPKPNSHHASRRWSPVSLSRIGPR